MTNTMPDRKGATIAVGGASFRLTMVLREFEERCPSSRWDVDFLASDGLSDVRARMSPWFLRTAWDGFLRDLRSLTSPYGDGSLADAALLPAIGGAWCLRLARAAHDSPPRGSPAFALSARWRMSSVHRTIEMAFDEPVDIDAACAIDRAFREA